MTMLRHINEDHVVPQLQLFERLYRLMMAPLAKAMHCEGSFAASSCVRDRLRRFGHLQSVSGVFLEPRVYICDPLLDVVDRHFSHFIWNVDGALILIRLQRF
jgi:hypothetical protein